MQLDERLVINDEGDVCIAEDYDGDIEEGMARYDKALGMGTPRPRRAVLEEVAPPFVPDYARWKPPADVAEISREEEGVACGALADGPEETFGPGDGGVREPGRTTECVPLMPTAEGERANRQNEIGEAAIEDRPEETFGQGDGGARDPYRREGSVPLNSAVEGERANRQNEIGEAGEAVAEGADQAFGRRDGRVADPRQTDEDGGAGDLRQTDEGGGARPAPNR